MLLVYKECFRKGVKMLSPDTGRMPREDEGGAQDDGLQLKKQ